MSSSKINRKKEQNLLLAIYQNNRNKTRNNQMYKQDNFKEELEVGILVAIQTLLTHREKLGVAFYISFRLSLVLLIKMKLLRDELVLFI